MRRVSGYLLGVLSLGAVLTAATPIAQANAPERSLRPVTRLMVFPVALPSFAPDRSLRPVIRPGSGGAVANVVPVSASVQSSLAALEPVAQPIPARVTREEKKARKAAGIGKICRDRDLIGKEVAPVPAKLPGCGIRRGAVKLYEVDGVALSTPAVMTCDTAKALKKWVNKGAKRAVRNYGGGIDTLKVAAGYSCRTRNHKKGAKISEHGKGKAIDISALVLENGDTISVLRDWGKGKRGRMLKKMHKSACGPFGTVLGPNSDRFHRDHFHFDTARHRGGPYCR
ncbi:extensin family protein [Shimia sp. R9_3]|uniref:extensin-like domain-containing protein n=1 Tax=Shimia sp. R9_3 TaxID=2821113 RepID=UPI001ADC635E|nr:extensin family protein [Shimia sp. R9_3]MBO9402356.1 extensin family protein [Shimia sp. R9_3]